MAETLNVNPTRGTLLRLQGQLERIKNQHDLLDRKREVLVRELMQRLQKAEALEEKSLAVFEAAHAALQTARMRMGTEKIEWVSFSPTARCDFDIAIHSIMGLQIPELTLEISEFTPPYGIGDTSAALDEAREKWLDVLRFLAEAADAFSAVLRLTMEISKTRRQVNALEFTLIPRYRNTIAQIESRLEEDEREEIVRAKKIQQMQE
jgi:V/A-type H+-transporting ATPase subunit D